MASESGGSATDREKGHQNHFALLAEGHSWSGREPNTLFQNRGDGTFEEVGNVMGLYLRLDSRGAGVADLDADGDLDLVVYNRNNPTIKIYRNDSPGQGNALQIDLRGTGPTAGARVEVECDESRFLRQVTLGGGFISQNPHRLHFGLGACTTVETIEVTWPSGEVERWSDLPVNHRIVLVQNEESEFESAAFEDRNYNQNDLLTSAGELSAPAPPISFRKLGGEEKVLMSELMDESLVLNFWATWCTACLVEMPELERLSREFENEGVRFLGISFDENKDDKEIEAFLAKREITYEQYVGEIHEGEAFWSLGASIPGSIPLTAVVHKGTVRAVFSGRVEVEDLRDILVTVTAPKD